MRSSGRKPDADRGAFAELAFGTDLTVHALDQMLDNGQSETGAAFCARTGRVGAIESLEDARQGFARNSGAVVLDLDLDPLAVGILHAFSVFDVLDQNCDPSTCGSISQRIVEKVREDLAQAAGIGSDLGSAAGRDLEANAAGVGCFGAGSP